MTIHCIIVLIQAKLSQGRTVTYARGVYLTGIWVGGGGGGVQPTQRNPDPVKDTKDVNFATLSKEKVL